MTAPVRDELVRALYARVGRFRATWDRASVLAPEAVRQASRLMACVPDPGGDPEAADAIAGFFRCRSFVLSGAEAARAEQIADALEPYARAVHERPGLPREAGVDPAAVARATAAAEAAAQAVAGAEHRPGRGALDEAVDLARVAVDRVPTPLVVLRAQPLTVLGLALRLRFEHSGTPADLEESVERLRTAEALTGAGHPVRRSAVSLLSTSLRLRYEWRSALADLNEAVAWARTAVDLCTGSPGPGSGHHLGGLLHNLGVALRLRYERTGAAADLDEAVACHRQALAVTPPGHRGRALFPLGLANALDLRRRLQGHDADRREQLAVLRAAYEAAGEPHPAVALAFAQQLVDGRGTDADRGPEQDRAPDGGATPDGGHGACPQDLGGDPERAERILRELDSRLPADASQRADLHYAMGRCHLARALRSHRRQDVAQAMDRFAAAARHPAARPFVRLGAAAGWGGTALTAGDPRQAAFAYGLAIELLPQLFVRHLAPQDVEHVLARFPSLASDAAACALEAGEPQRAVALLELGRAVLLGRGMQGRDDLAALRARSVELADELVMLRTLLDAPDGPRDEAAAALFPAAATPAPVANSTAADARHLLSRRWDDLLARIRTQLPGMEDFLRPPAVPELRRRAAARGPVVLVNVSRIRCDALVLTHDRLLTVPLARLTLQDAQARTDTFLSGLRTLADRGADPFDQALAQEGLVDCLAWLWEVLSRPVLDALRLGPVPADGARQRLWWVPTGPLTALPLHAAGTRQGHAGPDTVPSRVISSYAPTAQALVHARRPRPAAGDSEAGNGGGGGGGGKNTIAGPGSCLVVAVPEAAQALPLPRAAEEACTVAGLFPHTHVLQGPAAHRDAVVDALPGHAWLHFAGHGVADVSSPSSSSLVVHDHADRPLTVSRISRLDLSGAELAFLSACGTADPGQRLADEALHLASALQLAGYRHVVGTLWPIEDTVGMKVATGFHRQLREALWDPDQAAAALDLAVAGIRRTYPRAPSLWAAHVHVGG